MKAIKKAIAICCVAAMSSSMAVFPAKAAGQGIVINEVCAKNKSFAATDGNYYDWVELYNTSGSAVDIGGWGFTDKEDAPYRFTFPAGTVIQAGGRLVFYCDGTAGETNNSIAPFGLSTSGETLILTNKDGGRESEVTFGEMAADTSYGQYPDGSGDFYTLSCTPNSANKAPEGSNAVHQPVFSAESGFYDNNFSLSIDVPAGCTVYYTTDGSDPTTSSERYSSPISISDMTNTPNRLSARTDISAYDDILAPSGNVVKAAVIRAVTVDSQGRTSAVTTGTYFLGMANQSKYKNMKVISLVTDPDNLFDYDKGIYCLGATYDNGGGGGGMFPGFGGGGWGGFGGNNLNDGGDNNNNNNGWNFGGNADGIDWAGFGGGVAVNADNDWGGGFGGGGFGGMGDFAFMSPANYKNKGAEWERPASIEVFENGKSVLSQDVGIRIKGAASRAWAQKSFNIFARKDYGKGSLEYNFFDSKATKKKNGKVIDKFDGITIRNGGNDNMAGYFRDSLNQSLVADRAMTSQTTSECILFIDGEFWGIYQLMEKYNDDYFNSHYGVKKNNVTYIKNGELEEGEQSAVNEWNSLLSQMNGDMTNEASYRAVCEKLDIQSFIDYFASQMYWGNHDWPGNNTGVWKATVPVADSGNVYEDGKWRMVMFDTEYSANLADKVSETNPEYDSFNAVLGSGGGFGGWGGFGGGGGSLGGALAALLKNDEFRQQFELSFMDIANYNFDPEKATAAINYYKGFKQQVLDTYERFPSSKHTHNEATYNEDYQLLQTFYNTRYDNIVPQMKRSLNLTGELANVTVKNEGSKGTLKLNTITFGENESTWTGKYFTDYPVTVKAEAKEGYVFDHWTVTGATVSKDLSSPEIIVPVSNGVTIQASYKQSSTPVTTTTTTTKPTTTTTTTTAQPADNTLYGDANGDGKVTVADAAALLQYLGNKDKFPLDELGKKNADVDGTNGLSTSDAITIQKYVAGMVENLPVK